jgi:nitrogen regulatory protein PII
VENSSVNRYEALITIMDYGLRDVLCKLFNKSNIPVVALTHGYGSAKSVIFDILGYGQPKKIVSISIQTRSKASSFLNQLQQAINLNKPGTGIAFTIDVSSISSVLAMTLKQAEGTQEAGSEEVAVTGRELYDLIISIVNSSYFEQVMEAAKAAGATGGTLVHARALGSKEASKYLGITIQPEKDLVLILAPHEARHAIMESIVREVGLNTPGKGICFSLPVNHAVGMQAGIQNIDEL